MNVVFVSNFLNHHQIPLCENLKKSCEDFRFIATESGGSQGYQTSSLGDYLIDYKKERERCENLILTADAVIFGSCPDQLIKLRMDKNKLSFLYSERFFKRGTWRRFIPRTKNHIMQRVAGYKDKNMFVLCASAYLPYDLSFFGFPQEKMLKWGYFPAVKNYERIDEVLAEKEKNSILWVGRFLDWKHPEIPVKIAKKLKRNGYDFNLKLIGDGQEFEKIKKLIDKYDLNGNVSLLGSKSPEEVRLYMEKSQIFLFTSNKKEGWGAVLNEGMNSACAAVANGAAGSSRYLIENEKNGLIYGGDFLSAYLCVEKLLNDVKTSNELAKNAYSGLTDLWNANTACERFLKVCETLLNGEKIEFYQSGPCSAVKVIKG